MRPVDDQNGFRPPVAEKTVVRPADRNGGCSLGHGLRGGCVRVGGPAALPREIVGCPRRCPPWWQ